MAAALAALTAAALLPPAANAVIGQIRSTGDYKNVVPGTNIDPSRGKTGPNLAVNPANQNHIVQLVQDLETEECEFGVSLDGGTTWAGGELQAPATGSPAYPVNLPGPCDVTGHGASNIGQHAIDFGTGNNVYATWTATRQLGVQGFGILLSKSTDGGASYTSTEIALGAVAPGPSYSRPDIVIERRGATTDRLVIAARDDRTQRAIVVTSEDSGATWSAPVEVSNNNPVTNPPPVWNAEGTAVVTAGNAFRAANEVTNPVLGPAPTGPASGYRLVGANGAVFTFGNAGNFGSLAGVALAKPIVGSATTPSGEGYWMVASDGGIFTFGDAGFFGSTGNVALAKPIVGMASTPSGKGYWLVASDGGLFAYGDAGFFGSTGGIALDQPIVGMAPTPDGKGYWLVASDGGIFAFGNAGFFGSTGGIALDKPIVGMLPTASGKGYWLVASDGGIFAYGDAGFFGSTGGIPLTKPIIGMNLSPTGKGYNLIASDGGVFSFGDAAFFGSTGGTALAAPIVAASSSNKLGAGRPIYVAYVSPKIAGACPPSCEQPGENSTDGYLVVAKSTDNAKTWTRTRAVNARGFISPAGALFGGSHFPRIAVGNGGEVYMTFNQGPGVFGSNNCGSGPFGVGGSGAAGFPCPSFGPALFKQADHFMNWDMDVWFMRSTNQGATWGNLRQLNESKKPGLAAAELTQNRHPIMAVAPDGRVDIVWEDRRHWYLNPSDRKGAVTNNNTVGPTPASLGNYRCVHSHSNCDEARLGDTYYSYSSDGGVTFALNRRINDRSHNNDVGYDYRFSAYWDYGPGIVNLGNDRLLVADMDARGGNVDNESMDLYLRKVELNTTGPVPTAAVTGAAASAPDFSVALSRHTYPGGGEAVHGEGFTSRPWTRPVIVNEADFPSALAGGVLARANLGPVLASPAAGLPTSVKNEIDVNLNPVGAYVIGDATKLSAQVVTDLADAGVPAAQIVRIEGGTPAAIAANIAVAMDRRRAADKTLVPPLPAYDAVVIANPNSASAASAAALAANRRLPFLYSDQNSLPAETLSAITTLGVNKFIVVGSTGVVSNRILTAAARTITGATTTTGSATVVSATAAFTDGDVGRAVTGTAPDPANPTGPALSTLPAGTTITSVTSATTATLSANATLSATNGSIVVAARTVGIDAAGTTRLGGESQLLTSNAVVTESVARGLPRNQVYVANANEPMHAALLGAAVGRIGGLLILSQDGTAANAATTLQAPLNLATFVDKIWSSDLTGTATVGTDPGNVLP